MVNNCTFEMKWLKLLVKTCTIDGSKNKNKDSTISLILFCFHKPSRMSVKHLVWLSWLVLYELFLTLKTRTWAFFAETINVVNDCCLFSSVKCCQSNIRTQVKVELLCKLRQGQAVLKDDNYIFLSRKANVISPENMAEEQCCGQRSWETMFTHIALQRHPTPIPRMMR